MGHPPHPRVTPSGKGGSWRPHRGGKPSSERHSAAGARLINLGAFQSRPRPRPPRPLLRLSPPTRFRAPSPGWQQGPEPRKLLSSAGGHSRGRPRWPAKDAEAQRALRGHPQPSRLSSRWGFLLTASENEDGAARTGTATRQCLVRQADPLPSGTQPWGFALRARSLGVRLASRGVPWKRASPGHYVNILVHKGREDTVSLHSHSVTVTN